MLITNVQAHHIRVPYDAGVASFKQGATPLWMSPADTAAYRAADERRLAPVIKASGARVD